MAHLNFPIVRAGLVVDVLVNLKAAVLVPMWSGGGGPSPIPGRGLIDTGSDISAVALPILQRLGIPSLQPVSTQTFAGSIQVKLSEVSLHVLDARNVGLPWFSQPSLVVMEMIPGFPFDAILGMDVLRTCNLHVDGPGGRFVLDF